MPSSLPSWLQPIPLVETLRLELAPPHLNDNAGDLDRLVRALKQEGVTPIHVSPLRIDHLVREIRNARFNVAAVVGYASCHWELLDVFPLSYEEPILAFAVDLGTSSLAFYLLDLTWREIIAQKSIPNPQIPHGEDILTRILFARDEKNRQTLQKLLLDSFNHTMHEMLEQNGFHAEQVFAMAVAGNTTMSHFFLGLDPTHICREPYIPAVNRFPFVHARELGLSMHPEGLIYVFPNVGSYFGGDLVAGILAAGFHRSEELSLLVDVGTNAEVVLGNRDWLIACAGAAGPALEGGVMERGMMAAPGAIDRVRIDPLSLEPSYHVLGDEKPVGICGSGVIDAVAEMFRVGILTIQGKIDTSIESPRILKPPDGPAYVLATGEETADSRDLLITEIDVGIFLKSKAAMYTILTVILNKVGLSFKDIKRFYMAGTFGNYIDPAMAIRIGMIPDLPLETYRGLGNTAGRGAAMVLLDRSLLNELENVCDRITYIELNVNMELMNEFRGALFLPHTDPRLFPSVEIPERSRG